MLEGLGFVFVCVCLYLFFPVLFSNYILFLLFSQLSVTLKTVCFFPLLQGR